MCYKILISMGFFMKKIILICGLLTSSFSFGADWVVLDRSHGQESQIDMSSIKKLPSDKRLVWYRSITKAEEAKYVYLTFRAEIDCTRETLQNNDLVIHINDKHISQTTVENPKPFSPPPESSGQKIIQTTCKVP